MTQDIFCVFCVFQNKQRLFPCTLQLMGSYNGEGMCLQRGKELIFKLIQICLSLKNFRGDLYTKANKL